MYSQLAAAVGMYDVLLRYEGVEIAAILTCGVIKRNDEGHIRMPRVTVPHTGQYQTM